MLKSLKMKRTLIGLFLFAVCVLGLMRVQNVSAYNSKAHFDVIADCWIREGFSWDAIKRIQVYNTMVDLATIAERPEEWWEDITAFSPIGTIRSNIWMDLYADSYEISKNLDKNAHFQHFANYGELSKEWRRLESQTYRAVRQANRDQDVLALLAIIGMSTHEVQDFYAHTNWADLTDELTENDPGYWGGGDATWFDVSKEVKEKLGDHVYSDHVDAEHPSGTITHDNLNKDWAGRDHYETSFREAYYATVQWIEMIKTLADKLLWQLALAWDETDPYPTMGQLMQITWWAGAWTSGYSADDSEVLSFFLGNKWMHGGDWADSYYGTFQKYARIVFDQTLGPVDYVFEYKIIPEMKWLEIQTWRLEDVDDEMDGGSWSTEADMFTVIDIQVTNHYEAYQEDKRVQIPTHPSTYTGFEFDWGLTIEPIPWSPPKSVVSIRYWVYDEDAWDDWEVGDVSPIDGQEYWGGNLAVAQKRGYSFSESIKTQGDGDSERVNAYFSWETYLTRKPKLRTLRGDLNQDGTVNVLDLAMVAVAFLSTPGGPKWDGFTDLNNDGVVNVLDLAIIAKAWGSSVGLDP